MTHLAVAYLATGKANAETRRIEKSARRVAPDRIPCRSSCESNRIALLLGPVSPSIQHDERDGTRQI